VYDKPKDFRALEFISYDFNEFRPRMRVDMFIDEIGKNRTLFLSEYMFGREDEYVEVYTHIKDQCKKERRDRPFRKICVRDNHHEQLELTIGGHLRAKLFRYTREKTQSDMLVTVEKCIPIGGAFFEHQQHHYSFDAEVHFYDIREGIGNPVVWELPESCRNIPPSPATA